MKSAFSQQECSGPQKRKCSLKRGSHDALMERSDKSEGAQIVSDVWALRDRAAVETCYLLCILSAVLSQENDPKDAPETFIVVHMGQHQLIENHCIVGALTTGGHAFELQALDMAFDSAYTKLKEYLDTKDAFEYGE
ncbi:uncharacterized protein EV420DRAFT_1481207 [Desarmillaria tabescens]|uniref:Uncharacterized protein n=1 Tax=Armillaria tabescens TaxID=1929756 RepID=A0AA39K7K3_ARMTA|nr:uncharacterized protein EV420DRAFT_1481207 [Desarmillaria tabescens]KAK0455768.1 hypothetical protein EV420DRAFT_1481207 [Desarmillaria tabescens]